MLFLACCATDFRRVSPGKELNDESKLAGGACGGSHSAVSGRFGHLGSKTAYLTGKPATFLLALLIVVLWGVTGPLFHYSDTWQLVINTGTTIITFLMVFLIQTRRRVTRRRFN